ncbi:MAG: hypothetical protein RHS_2032 [Robinsoniella sp. RHS]|nr:MAG: hypothetical protein RHS_2032 [Robinsoniella sp. RHS]
MKSGINSAEQQVVAAFLKSLQIKIMEDNNGGKSNNEQNGYGAGKWTDD